MLDNFTPYRPVPDKRHICTFGNQYPEWEMEVYLQEGGLLLATLRRNGVDVATLDKPDTLEVCNSYAQQYIEQTIKEEEKLWQDKQRAISQQLSK